MADYRGLGGSISIQTNLPEDWGEPAIVYVDSPKGWTATEVIPRPATGTMSVRFNITNRKTDDYRLIDAGTFVTRISRSRPVDEEGGVSQEPEERQQPASVDGTSAEA